jgi:F0F1-type ATP synthase membrane subunit b/b'
MRIFKWRNEPCAEAESAKQDAQRSLEDAQAKHYEVEAKLIESRMVEETIRAHNRSNAYSDWLESIVLGRREEG